jgi:hypothetical protein
MTAARLRYSILITVVLACAAGAALLAQAPTAAVTAADYARAEKFLAAGVNPLVVGGSASATWLPDERFTYRSTAADGVTFYLVSPAAKTRVPAFDHAKVAAALATAAGATISATALPFQAIQISPDGKSVSFDYNRLRWTGDVLGAACASTGDAAAPHRHVENGCAWARYCSEGVPTASDSGGSVNLLSGR